jgi:hypothetical protein
LEVVSSSPGHPNPRVAPLGRRVSKNTLGTSTHLKMSSLPNCVGND